MQEMAQNTQNLEVQMNMPPPQTQDIGNMMNPEPATVPQMNVAPQPENDFDSMFGGMSATPASVPDQNPSTIPNKESQDTLDLFG